MGANLQGDRDQQMAGVEGYWATPVGTFGLDLAGSRSGLLGAGTAARLQYLYFDATTPRQPNLSVSMQYSSPSFAALGTPQPTNPASIELTASYSQKLFAGLYGSVFGGYGRGRSGQPNTESLSLASRRRFWRDLDVSLTLSRQNLEDQAVENRALLTATWYLTSHHQRLTTSSDTRDQTSSADWNYNPPKTTGLVHAEVRAQRSDLGEEFFGEADYVGNRGQVEVSEDATPGGTAGERTSVQFGTALVFAGGVFAVTRPVTGSFVIVDRHANLHGQTIGLDPFADAYEAKADNLGPGVVSTLGAYTDRELVLDAPELPLGLELGPTEFAVHATYKSGALPRVGTGASVLLDAMLTNADGEAAFWQTGEITSTDDPKWPAVSYFTNQAGRLRVEGLKPGRYQLRPSSDPTASLQFEIPHDATGLYDLGTLRLPAAAAPPPSAKPAAPVAPPGPEAARPPGAAPAAPPVAIGPPVSPPIPAAVSGLPPSAPAGGTKPDGVPLLRTRDWAGEKPVYVVRVSSFRERTKADADAARLAALFGTIGCSVEVDLDAKGIWYRVVLGEFGSAAEAQQFEKDIAPRVPAGVRSVYRMEGPAQAAQ